MTGTPLAAAGSVQLDAQGAGSVTFTVPWGQVWHLTRCTVTVTVDDPMPTAHCYRGVATATNLLGGSHSGALDSGVCASPEVIGPGELVTVVWAGGAPGATATAVLGGTVEAQ